MEQHKEFLLWFQKARELHLLDGDQNTRYFHFSTISRRRFNDIYFIKDSHGWLRGTREVAGAFVLFYENLFQTESPEFPEDLDELFTLWSLKRIIVCCVLFPTRTRLGVLFFFHGIVQGP